MIRRFVKDEGGATAMEYAFLASLIAMACLLALEALGTSLGGIFTVVDTKLKATSTP